MLPVRLQATRSARDPRAILTLLKPVTWFAAMWALLCGAVAAGTPGVGMPWLAIALGMVLAGPVVCGGTQAANDWFDRHVDTINQPDRPIPSGRVPGRQGLHIALGLSALALILGAALGLYVFLGTCAALALGWAYSAPPFRLKREGWVGAAATGLAYEGVAWITGALLVGGADALAQPLMVPLAFLYSVGALGIMVLNDFKAVEGDRRMGVRSLPAALGTDRAAMVSCAMMLGSQGLVTALLWQAGRSWHAAAIGALMVGQALLMRRLLRDPERHAPWYNATGVTLFVAGMMVAAFAIRQAGA